MALSVGTDAGYLSRIERGDRLPSLLLLENIAKSLGTTPSAIYAAAEQLECPNQTEATTSLSIADVSDDGLNLRLIFRNLSKANQRIAVELLKVLEKNQA